MLIGGKPMGGLDFEAIEMSARRKAIAFVGRVIEQKMNSDHSDYVGPTRLCGCGARAKYGGRKSKVFVTAVGEMRLGRAYYYCDVCERGFF